MKKIYVLLILAMAGITPSFAQWNTNATPACIFGLEYTDPVTGETKTGGDYYACHVKAARTADKKTWLAWKIWGKKNIRGIDRDAVRTYLQLLDINGVPQFDEPILVNDHMTTSWWSEYALRVAADGSAIVTVADERAEEASVADTYTTTKTTTDDQGNVVEKEVTETVTHGDGFQPAIYKIDQQGNFLWGLDGVEYPEYVNAAFTNAYVIGDDTYFIFSNTVDDATLSGTFVQRISDDGVPAWDTPKRWSDVTMQLQLLPSLDGDLLAFDITNDGSRVQRMNSDLELQWDEPVIYDEHSYGGYEMNHYEILSDGNGGACVAFQRPVGNFSHNIRAQHINEDGSLGFGLTGLDAYNSEDNDHNYPALAVNTETQEMLIQFASQLPSTGNIMHQKFSFDGDYLYDELGLSIASKDLATNSYMFGNVGVGSLKCGDWIAVYRDLAAWNKESLVIRRYDTEGKRLWTRTIGRDISPDGITLIVEEEAVYLVYRECNDGKQPGVKIFRIGTDGTYNVTYDESVGISQPMSNMQATTYYSIDGKQLQAPQRGLNLVRLSDGTVVKKVNN